MKSRGRKGILRPLKSIRPGNEAVGFENKLSSLLKKVCSNSITRPVPFQ